MQAGRENGTLTFGGHLKGHLEVFFAFTVGQIPGGQKTVRFSPPLGHPEGHVSSGFGDYMV